MKLIINFQNWEPGKYFLASLNFGGLEDTKSFNVSQMILTTSHYEKHYLMFQTESLHVVDLEKFKMKRLEKARKGK